MVYDKMEDSERELGKRFRVREEYIFNSEVGFPDDWSNERVNTLLAPLKECVRMAHNVYEWALRQQTPAANQIMDHLNDVSNGIECEFKDFTQYSVDKNTYYAVNRHEYDFRHSDTDNRVFVVEWVYEIKEIIGKHITCQGYIHKAYFE